MEQGSRPPKKSHAKVVESSPLVPGSQAPVPKDLSPDEAVEWQRFAGQMPADWFTPETWPLLSSLCRHICMERWCAEGLQQVRAGDDSDLERIDKLANMLARHSRIISLLTVRLGLAPQARFREAEREVARGEVAVVQPWKPAPETTGNPPGGSKPWAQ